MVFWKRAEIKSDGVAQCRSASDRSSWTMYPKIHRSDCNAALFNVLSLPVAWAVAMTKTARRNLTSGIIPIRTATFEIDVRMGC